MLFEIPYKPRIPVGLLAAVLLCHVAMADSTAHKSALSAAANYTSQRPAALEDLNSPASVGSGDYQLRTGDLQFHAFDTRFMLGIDYEYTHYEYSGIDSRDRDLHSLAIPIRFSTESDGWRIDGYVAPVIATSSNVFKDFLNHGSARDVYINTMFEVHVPNSPWFIGAAFDRRFGSAHPYPVFGAWVHASPAIDLRLAFPDPAAVFRISERLTADVRIYPAGQEWRVVTDDFANEFDYRMEAIRSQVNWNIRLTENWSVDLGIAYESEREHRLVDRNGALVDSTVDSEWLLVAGFRFGNASLPYAHGVGYWSNYH